MRRCINVCAGILLDTGRTDEALELMDAAGGRPFFLNLWHLVPHTPYEPTPEPHWSRYRDPGISEDQHCFRAMVAHMDAKVGQLVAKLNQLGIREKTLIVFTSDNGGAYEADIGPLKGGKTDLHEGGIRVPLIIRDPRLPVATRGRRQQMALNIDLAPTILTMAGLPVPAGMQGVNLQPLLRDAATKGREDWYYEHVYTPEPGRRPAYASGTVEIEVLPVERTLAVSARPAEADVAPGAAISVSRSASVTRLASRGCARAPASRSISRPTTTSPRPSRSCATRSVSTQTTWSYRR